MVDLTILSSGPFLLATWEKLKRVPGGRAIFSRIVGQLAPFSGTIQGSVDELSPGHARISMRDRRRVRNHLNSVHAIAAANLAELASGLALVASVPADSRGILVGFQISYKKKGRGTLTAESRFDPEPVKVHGEHEVPVMVLDGSGSTVAEARARWLVGPVVKA